VFVYYVIYHVYTYIHMCTASIDNVYTQKGEPEYNLLHVEWERARMFLCSCFAHVIGCLHVHCSSTLADALVLRAICLSRGAQLISNGYLQATGLCKASQITHYFCKFLWMLVNYVCSALCSVLAAIRELAIPLAVTHILNGKYLVVFGKDSNSRSAGTSQIKF